jgi:hypothetical protein
MGANHACSEKDLAHYTCRRIGEQFPINGDLGKPCWRRAPKSGRFVDLVTGAPGFFDTRMAALWDDDNLYIGFWIQEPDVRASLTKRDSFIWNENDVEVFIGGEDCYYEFQINALGTVYEVFYIWQDALRKGSRFSSPEFDLADRRVDVLGGFQDASRHGRHPRGARWAFMDWDFPGLKSAVRVQGTLNASDDVDDGWTVELAFPWKGMAVLAGSRPIPPLPGDVWRMDFSRFERLEYCGVRAEPHPGWALNRHGIYDSHIPECFSYIHFGDGPGE